MVTALTVLLELGDGAWSKSIVEYIPELRTSSETGDPLNQVHWENVSLGALASHSPALLVIVSGDNLVHGSILLTELSRCLPDHFRLPEGYILAGPGQETSGRAARFYAYLLSRCVSATRADY